jgi:hypothetical protein
MSSLGRIFSDFTLRDGSQGLLYRRIRPPLIAGTEKDIIA